MPTGHFQVLQAWILRLNLSQLSHHLIQHATKLGAFFQRVLKIRTRGDMRDEASRPLVQDATTARNHHAASFGIRDMLFKQGLRHLSGPMSARVERTPHTQS